MRPNNFIKTLKTIPKHIVYYNFGSHSAQLVRLYSQILKHKFFNFNFIK